MPNLFKRAMVLTDIHYGLKSNSLQHNEDCMNFIKWATEFARTQNCETCLFLGDYHNNRASINILTLNYSLRGLEHLNDNFEQVFFIPGNHDLYYRDRRDIQSVEWARHLPRVKIVNDWFAGEDVVIAPWLVGDDYKRIARMQGRYMFGHFELPGYLMNAMVEMPDHGGASREHFTGFEHVFSGHFHKRQTQKNITYIGNCFPHKYSDAGDDQRGADQRVHGRHLGEDPDAGDGGEQQPAVFHGRDRRGFADAVGFDHGPLNHRHQHADGRQGGHLFPGRGDPQVGRWAGEQEAQADVLVGHDGDRPLGLGQ